MEPQKKNVLNFLGDLGNAALGNLERLLNVRLLLHGRAEGLGAAGKVARQVGALSETVRVLSNEIIEGGLEIALLEALVAKQRKENLLACGGLVIGGCAVAGRACKPK